MRSAKSRSAEGGFSLIETTIATGLMAVAALGVAQLFVVAGNSTFSSKSQTSTTVLATHKMEQLRSLGWGYEEGGGGAVGARVTDLTTNLAVDPPASDGGGLTPSPAGTLDKNTLGFVDYLDADGKWLGTGTSPPNGTVYIRRWAIEPLPANPNETLIFQVLVTPLRREVRKKAGVTGPRGKLTDDTVLVSVKTRKAL
jgi:type II secretory pathway pseudopilin PulG